MKVMEEEKKIYIGNLEYSVTEEELKSLFEEKGLSIKEVAIVRDKYTNRSKGFGFGKFDTEEEVLKAIDTLNGYELKSRNLNISKARRRNNSKFENRRSNNTGYRQRRNY